MPCGQVEIALPAMSKLKPVLLVVVVDFGTEQLLELRSIFVCIYIIGLARISN